VAPWGVVSRHGHWYLVGHDHDREAVRVFRLSRIRGPVEMGDTPHAFSRPEGVDLVGLVDDDDSTAPLSLAQLEVRPGAAHALRRDATAVDGDVLTVPYRDPRRFTDRLVGHGSDVTVLGPPELRDAVIARLRAVAGQ
jgi:proteasome accessory factor B